MQFANAWKEQIANTISDADGDEETDGQGNTICPFHHFSSGGGIKMQQSHVHVYQALTGLVNSLIAFLGNWLQEEQLHPSIPFHRGHLLINKSFQISTFVMLDKQKTRLVWYWIWVIFFCIKNV